MAIETDQRIPKELQPEYLGIQNRVIEDLRNMRGVFGTINLNSAAELSPGAVGQFNQRLKEMSRGNFTLQGALQFFGNDKSATTAGSVLGLTDVVGSGIQSASRWWNQNSVAFNTLKVDELARDYAYAVYEQRTKASVFTVWWEKAQAWWSALSFDKFPPSYDDSKYNQKLNELERGRIQHEVRKALEKHGAGIAELVSGVDQYGKPVTANPPAFIDPKSPAAEQYTAEAKQHVAPSFGQTVEKTVENAITAVREKPAEISGTAAVATGAAGLAGVMAVTRTGRGVVAGAIEGSSTYGKLLGQVVGLGHERSGKAIIAAAAWSNKTGAEIAARGGRFFGVPTVARGLTKFGVRAMPLVGLAWAANSMTSFAEEAEKDYNDGLLTEDEYKKVRSEQAAIVASGALGFVGMAAEEAASLAGRDPKFAKYIPPSFTDTIRGTHSAALAQPGEHDFTYTTAEVEAAARNRKAQPDHPALLQMRQAGLTENDLNTVARGLGSKYHFATMPRRALSNEQVLQHLSTKGPLYQEAWLQAVKNGVTQAEFEHTVNAQIQELSKRMPGASRTEMFTPTPTQGGVALVANNLGQLYMPDQEAWKRYELLEEKRGMLQSALNGLHNNLDPLRDIMALHEGKAPVPTNRQMAFVMKEGTLFEDWLKVAKREDKMLALVDAKLLKDNVRREVKTSPDSIVSGELDSGTHMVMQKFSQHLLTAKLDVYEALVEKSITPETFALAQKAAGFANDSGKISDAASLVWNEQGNLPPLLQAKAQELRKEAENLFGSKGEKLKSDQPLSEAQVAYFDQLQKFSAETKQLAQAKPVEKQASLVLDAKCGLAGIGVTGGDATERGGALHPMTVALAGIGTKDGREGKRDKDAGAAIGAA